MRGGVILYRGSGADARRYLESDRSRADDYYLEGGTALAEFSVVDGNGDLIGEGALTPTSTPSGSTGSTRSPASRWARPATPAMLAMDRRGSPRWSSTRRSRCRSPRRFTPRYPMLSMLRSAMRLPRSASGSARMTSARLGLHSTRTQIDPTPDRSLRPMCHGAFVRNRPAVWAMNSASMRPAVITRSSSPTAPAVGDTDADLRYSALRGGERRTSRCRSRSG
jgi:hypothetical protein